MQADSSTAAASQAQPNSDASSQQQQQQQRQEQHRQPPPRSRRFHFRISRLLSTLAIIPVVIYLEHVFGGLSGVRGTSMSPTLNPHAIVGSDIGPNDVVFVWRYRRPDNYAQGEVVTLTSPTNPRVRTTKRLIALEGDSVRDQQDPRFLTFIPRGRCWLEGDNARTSTDDSRKLGPIPLALVDGVVTHVVWPPSRWGRVQATLEPAGGEERIIRRTSLAAVSDQLRPSERATS